ncbi:hypothetical protein BD560DRAFT_30904 [Blakeslea trispora]|nr:hypothetical protein BD560DRAFT_30904 [Blakeslea trispora]
MKPMSTDAANHLAARSIRNAGLNTKGALYSFRRNFASIITDTLSNETAFTLMGHNPYAKVLRQCFAKTFPNMNMTELVNNCRPTNTPSLSALLTPAAFHTKDIKRYNLTSTDSNEILNDESYTTLVEAKLAYTKERQLRYGSKSRKVWTESELDTVRQMQLNVKRRRRLLTMRRLKQKHTLLYEAVERSLVVNEQGETTLDERLLDEFAAAPALSQESLNRDEDEEDRAIERDEIFLEASETAKLMSSQQ